MDYSKWLAAIETSVSWQLSTLLSIEEFEEQLKLLVGPDSPISAVRFQLKSEQNTLFSVNTDELADYLESGRFEKGHQVLTCEFFRSDPASSYDLDVGSLLPTHLRKVFDSFWKYDIRDDKAGLPTTNNSRVRSLTNAFINRQISQGKYVGCAFLDGDDFGAINKNFSHQVGDGVIRHAGKFFGSIANSHNCIIVRDGGDEFIVLAGVHDKQDFVTMIWSIYNQLKDLDWNLPGDQRLTFSAGISFWGLGDGECSYDEIRAKAERALMSEYGGERQKQRNTISLEDSYEAPIAEEAYCLLSSQVRLGDRRPFENAWMNLVASQLYEALISGNSVSASLEALINDLKLQSNQTRRNYSVECTELSGEKKLSLIDIAVSVFHGIGRFYLTRGKCESVREVNLMKNEEAVQVECGDIQVQIPEDFSDEYVGDLKVGVIPRFTDGRDNLGLALKVGLLIHIDEASADLLALPFYDRIFVDDRPTKGGELPDFVAHSISRLLEILATNPNIQRVYCWGDERYGKKTADIVRRMGNGELDEQAISAMVGRPESEVAKLCNRIESKVIFVSKVDEIVHDYLRATNELIEILPFEDRASLSSPRLIRALSEEVYSLSIEEGFTAKSVAEAFPLALEILRDPNRVEIVNDRYGKKFHELVDFKIVIKRPSSSGGLEYANMSDEELDAYYQRAFGPQGKSLFGDKYGDQIEPFMTELERSITGDPTFNSRRAILVVPNIVEDGRVNPLGLVSIRASTAVIGRASCAVP